MCQIMFYNKLPTSDTIHKWTLAPEVVQFHIGALTDVESGQWGRTKCPAIEPMCQLMFYNQLPTSDTIHKWPWLQKWAGSKSVPSPLWNPATGANTKCLAMKPMCQIMFYN